MHSLEEYLKLESVAEGRHEYYRGEITSLPGGSWNHSLIISNIHGNLYKAVQGRPIATYVPNVSLKVQATGLYTYADVTVCDRPTQFERGPIDVLLNPKIIFEVLSSQTEEYDRGFKAKHYRQIPSVMEILLVSQSEPLIEHYIRTGDDEWALSNCTGLESTLKLPSIDCEIPMARIYAGAEWPDENQVERLH